MVDLGCAQVHWSFVWRSMVSVLMTVIVQLVLLVLVNHGSLVLHSLGLKVQEELVRAVYMLELMVVIGHRREMLVCILHRVDFVGLVIAVVVLVTMVEAQGGFVEVSVEWVALVAVGKVRVMATLDFGVLVCSVGLVDLL